MKNRISFAAVTICLLSLTACSQDKEPILTQDFVSPTEEIQESNQEPHSYGGWYCPDNLNGFPAVDIANWRDVPVVNGRLCTQEESRNGTSLIFVDTEKYPNAKPLDITMPKLASIFNRSSQREEVIIVIQALNIQEDSIVGFRYLNGGNGSARLNEIEFIDKKESQIDSESKFVSLDFDIKATQEEVWQIINNRENTSLLLPTFQSNKDLAKDWRSRTNVNYAYPNSGKSTALFGQLHYGCYYIQNDFEKGQYSEKILLLEDEEKHETTMKMSFGPFKVDYESQENILKNWGQKVKDLSENRK